VYVVHLVLSVDLPVSVVDSRVLLVTMIFYILEREVVPYPKISRTCASYLDTCSLNMRSDVGVALANPSVITAPAEVR